MKLVATLIDFSAVIHCGGGAEHSSEIITIPDEQLPPDLKRMLKLREEMLKGGPEVNFTVSFSILQEQAQ